MKGEKYHIYLSTKERNEIVVSLINLKNKLIEQGRYTDAVDDVLFKVLNCDLTSSCLFLHSDPMQRLFLKLSVGILLSVVG